MGGVRVGECLGHRAYDVKSGGLGKLGEFFQRGINIPFVIPPIDGDKECSFRRGNGFVRLSYGFNLSSECRSIS